LRRFPYAVFFVAESARVVVLAVLHQSEDPKKWPQIR
jgi:plasmid stabilization system protein ParE